MKTNISSNPRRGFIRQLGGLSAGIVGAPLLNAAMYNSVEAAVRNTAGASAATLASDEDFWYSIQQAYTSSPGVLNFNNGGVSPQPEVVQDALDRYTRIANEGPAYYMWQTLGKGRELVREKLGKMAGCSADELAICRNATEALETIIFGLNLKKGDEIVTTNQDYPNMRNALLQRERRDGIKVKFISIPVATEDPSKFVQLYKDAITPKTKAILVSHVINLTGQIMPVRQIADIAHERGIEVIVDGAHSFGHFNFNIADLGADYFGTSLHKWLCAPFGTGMLYVKKEKIEKLWPLYGPPEEQDMTDIRKFEHLGTRSFPSELAIGHAVNFHNGIGIDRKEARLRFLKERWVNAVAEIPGVKFNTAMTSDQSCGIANVFVEGKNAKELQRSLFKQHNVYTVHIKHDEFEGVRVSPHIYTTLNDIDQLIDGIKSFARA